MWQRRAEMDLYIPISNAFRHSSPMAKAIQPNQIVEWADLCLARAVECMEWLDSRLSDRVFLAGDAFSIADITAFCAFGLGENTGTIEIPDTMTNLLRWRERVAQRPSASA